jgi:hypothetical protein
VIRRLFLVAAAAVALMLAPTVAMAFNAPMAYNAPGYNSTVSDASPGIGQKVTVRFTGKPLERITLRVTCVPASASGVIEVAGSASLAKSQTKQLNSKGEGTFSLRFKAAGVCTLTMTNAAGAVVSTQTVTVLGANVNAAAPAAGTLSNTGFGGMPLVYGGGVLVLLGAGAVLVARRRKSSQASA